MGEVGTMGKRGNERELGCGSPSPERYDIIRA